MDTSPQTPQIIDILSYTHLPLEDAAHRLRMCKTLLKARCREAGIGRWPYQKPKSKRKRVTKKPVRYIGQTTVRRVVKRRILRRDRSFWTDSNISKILAREAEESEEEKVVEVIEPDSPLLSLDTSYKEEVIVQETVAHGTPIQEDVPQLIVPKVPLITRRFESPVDDDFESLSPFGSPRLHETCQEPEIKSPLFNKEEEENRLDEEIRQLFCKTSFSSPRKIEPVQESEINGVSFDEVEGADDPQDDEEIDNLFLKMEVTSESQDDVKSFVENLGRITPSPTLCFIV